jgi:hypothetical protein
MIRWLPAAANAAGRPESGEETAGASGPARRTGRLGRGGAGSRPLATRLVGRYVQERLGQRCLECLDQGGLARTGRAVEEDDAVGNAIGRAGLHAGSMPGCHVPGTPAGPAPAPTPARRGCPPAAFRGGRHSLSQASGYPLSLTSEEGILHQMKPCGSTTP